MALKVVCAIILLAAPVTAQFQWKIGDLGQTCSDVCPGECLNTVSVDSVAAFQSFLTNIFPAGTVPCDDTQAGEIAYDPSISDNYCGWSMGVTTTAAGPDFSCDAHVPKSTRRFCPCGEAPADGVVVGDTVTEDQQALNLKKVNGPEYARWKTKGEYARWKTKIEGEGLHVQALEDRGAPLPKLAAKGGSSVFAYMCGVVAFAIVGGFVYRLSSRRTHQAVEQRDLELIVE